MARKTLDSLDPIRVAEHRAALARKELDKLWRDTDKLLDANGDYLKKGVTEKMFNDKLREVNRATNALFGAVDQVVFLQKHKDDPPTEPRVPVEDVKSVVGASLSDKMDELSFSVNHGILGDKIAKAIRMSVSEDSFDVPLCEDHRG